MATHRGLEQLVFSKAFLPANTEITSAVVDRGLISDLLNNLLIAGDSESRDEWVEPFVRTYDPTCNRHPQSHRHIRLSTRQPHESAGC